MMSGISAVPFDDATLPPIAPAPFGEAYWRNPDAVMRELAAHGAAHHRQFDNGVKVWVVPGYEHGRAVLSDPARFAKDLAGIGPIVAAHLAEAGHPQPPHAMFDTNPVFSEGEQHRRLRSVLAAAFTTGRIEGLRPRVREVVTEHLDHLAQADGPVDLVAELAFPLPLTILSELLGMPRVDYADLRRWTRALMCEVPAEAETASAEMSAYVRALVDTKRARIESGGDPGDDLLSAMIAARVDGDRLTDAELYGTAFLLVVAGHETTMNSLANGAALLLEEPQRWRELAERPELVPAAVDELLRLTSTTRHSTYRYTTEAVTIGDTTIPANELVLVAVHAANRDPDRFGPDADAYRLDRPAEQVRAHLAFGHGPHRCMGARVAHMEITDALTQLTTRFPDARLAAPLAEQPYDRSPVMLGRPRLMVRLRP